MQSDRPAPVSEEPDDVSDRELLEIALAEAHRSIDSQIATLEDIDTKAARIMRLNLLLLSVLIGALSIAATTAPGTSVAEVWNGYIALGLTAILLSTAVAAITYTATTIHAGMDGHDLQELLDNEYSARENIEGVIESYAVWTRHNYGVNARNAPLSTIMLLLLIYGLVAMSVGVYHSARGPVGTGEQLAILFALAVATWRTGISRQLRRWLSYRMSDYSED